MASAPFRRTWHWSPVTSTLNGAGRKLLTIHSSNSSRTLLLEATAGSYLTARLEGHEVSGCVEVWVETGDVAGLAAFFGELGRLEKPWTGARSWGSLESDLSVSVTCTSLGAVTFRVSMSGMPGAPEEWRLQAGIETEFGQLARLAMEADALGSAHDAT
jgi:hypothetical protein